jgi:hypothetical protein
MTEIGLALIARRRFGHFFFAIRICFGFVLRISGLTDPARV